MSYHLVITAGPESGRSFPLEDGQRLVIGRGQASHTRINDPRMSRVHCEIHVVADHVSLTDAGQTSGTLVKGQPVQRCLLKPGDLFQAGESQFRLQLASGTEATTLGGQTPVADKPKLTPTQASPLEKLVGQTFAHFRLDKVLA